MVFVVFFGFIKLLLNLMLYVNFIVELYVRFFFCIDNIKEMFIILILFKIVVFILFLILELVLLFDIDINFCVEYFLV